ncbi:hypothetical protein ARMGADRAFT_1087720 [Armillaria gallica]|uniref:Uncharacterized protein n=1 Tax=Armillaria gallica TaxID=47427 RepID=A0A2H3CUZ9_ARMGA|nr:hypothetical protein ARMGADRAFT_1087720 [Armillaria gallica]
MTSPPQMRASSLLFSDIEEPSDDTSPCGPSSLGTHHHDNAMFNNSSSELTMDGNMVMLPPLGPSSLDQEADNPYPQDNTTLNNPFLEESGSDCIHSMPTLARYNLFLHSYYWMIHCHNKIGSEECGTVQLPYAVPGHLQSQHQFIFNTAKEKKDLEAYILMLNPVTDAQAFINPKPGLVPVKGLKMEKEGKLVIYLQQSIVEPSSAKHSNSGEEDPFMIFLKTVASAIEKESTQVLPEVIRPWKVPPLVKMKGWHLHLADYITDHQKVKNLHTLVKPPPKRVNGTIPDLIHQVVFGYLDAIGVLHGRLSMTGKKLLFNPEDPSQLFTMHDEPAMQQVYGYLLFIFVYAILTSRTSSIMGYKFPLTTSDDKNTKHLMKAIRNKTLELETSEHLHSFLVPLFSPHPSA